MSSDIQNIAKNLHPLERKVVPYLATGMSLAELAQKSKLSIVEAMRALQWLSNRKALSITDEKKELIELGKNGTDYQKKGLPERRFLSALSSTPLGISQISKKAGLDSAEVNICIGLLKRKAAIDISKEKEMMISLTDAGKGLVSKETLEEKFLKKKFPLDPSSLAEEEKFAFSELKKRKGIVALNVSSQKIITLTDLGKKLKTVKVSGKVEDKLTSSMLKTGKWKGKTFREYDVSINVPAISGGKRHFVSQAVDYIRKIWLEMGFEEMSGNMVQTSFWDLDSLFVPQDHPAREEQDTFYIKDPASGTLPPIAKKIKDVHENGGDTGSSGWGGKWSPDVAKENLLRTHTTVLSAQTIARLRDSQIPSKFFSVGKVFRNESLDPKHLFEFYQVEGIVVDPDANFTHLKGYLREFFTKMGYPDVRIRPGHFGYTEPSAEIEVLHPVTKKWIELGGCGVFRAEVTKPLMGKEVPVLAWGLGLGRIISEYWNISDIRELYKNDLKQLREMKAWMK